MDVALLKSKCNDTPPHTTRFLGNHHDGTVGSISIIGCANLLMSKIPDIFVTECKQGGIILKIIRTDSSFNILSIIYKQRFSRLVEFWEK